MRPLNRLVVHCSATANGQSLFEGKAGQPGFKTPADVIDGWHAARGFHRDPSAVSRFNPSLPHIGYHFVIGTNGSVFTGRSIVEVGAHVQGFNSDSIGICMVGTSAFASEQWATLAWLLKDLCQKNGIPIQFAAIAKDRNARGVCGHRDFSPDQNKDGIVEPFEWLKTCPGFDVETYIASAMKPPKLALLPGDAA